MLACVIAIFLLRRRAKSSPARAMVLTGTTLSFDGGAPRVAAAPVLELDEHFGLTLVANRARTRATMVLSTTTSTFYVGTAFKF